MKPIASIKKWSLHSTHAGEYYLIGEVNKHPRQEEFLRELQATSKVLRIDFEKGEAETMNTIYKLEGGENADVRS